MPQPRAHTQGQKAWVRERVSDKGKVFICKNAISQVSYLEGIEYFH